MAFAIFVDTDDAVAVNIHEDSCRYYVDRKRDATSTVWCQADTIEDAEVLAKRLALKKGCKHADCCLDGEWIPRVSKYI